MTIHSKFKQEIEITTELEEAIKLMLPICNLCKEFKKNLCPAVDILCGRKFSLYKQAKKIEQKKLSKRKLK